MCDRSVAGAGLLDRVREAAGSALVPLCELVDPDPTVNDAEESAARACAERPDAVVIVGGGSAMALGKAVALRLRNLGPIDRYAGIDRAPAGPAPCVAIPTTAGSGSEVSNALTLHAPGQEQILVVRGRGYEPTVAILDGTLLATLPRRPMVEAGLDALSHALEALWAVNASPFTDALALAAVDRICVTFPSALEQRNPADLQAMLEASAMSNLASGNAGLGLVHALSSAAEVHLAHGYQNGVLVPAVAAFNAPELRPPVASAVDRARRLYAAIGFEPRFSQDELDDRDVERMLAAARDHVFRTNNIRPSSEADLRAILAQSGAPDPSQ